MTAARESRDIERLFDNIAPIYDDMMTDRGYAANDMLRATLANEEVMHPVALDLGAGTGATTATVMECTQPKSVTAVDTSEKMLDILGRRFAGDPRIHIQQMAIEQYLAETERTFDLVTAIGVMHYNSRQGEIIAAIKTVLNRAGWCMFTYDPIIPGNPNQPATTHYEEDDIYVHRRSPETIDDEIEKSGLTVVSHRMFTPQPLGNSTYVTGFVAARKP